MAERNTIIRERARRIVEELTRAVENGAAVPDGGPLVSVLFDFVTGGEALPRDDRYVQRFVFDAAQAAAEKPWNNPDEVCDRLPPYGFRREEEILQWAHWFGSHRSRTLSVNRFLVETQDTQIRRSVNDLMYETFRYEQKAIAAKVMSYLAEDARW